MDTYRLLLGALITWRITHLLGREDGPGRWLARLRAALGSGFWSTLVDCFYCLSLWVALPLAFLLVHDVRQALLLWPALSAASILLERVSSKEPAPAAYVEDPEPKE